MDGKDVETAPKQEMRFNLQVEDGRQNKDASQQFALSERLKADKVDVALQQTHEFIGEYAANRPQDLSIKLVDGNIGEGTINGSVIELQLPGREQAVAETRGFIEPLLKEANDEDKDRMASELATALTVSTALHEGVHGLLDSRPGSKFSSDFEAATGFPNEQGRASTLLDEGVAYAIQGIYAPDIEPIGSLAPVARETDEREVGQRKILGEKLKPMVQEYLDEDKSIDADFFERAKQSIIETQTQDTETEDAKDNSLTSFTSSELRSGASLPDKISSINHDIESGDKSKMDVVVEQAAGVAEAVSSSTNNEFVMLGSMGMYLTLSEIRQGDERFALVDQRISGGKNDYDIGVHPDELSATMEDFSWDEQAQKLQRGKVAGNNQMVDLMSRRELSHFPWQEVQVEGQKYTVQSPEEMIFEKMSSLIEPGVDDEGQPRGREIKWGVDIKLLKSYLKEKNDWSDEQVEKHLADRWNDYVEDTRYQGVGELVEQAEAGKPVPEIIEDAVRARVGKEEITDVRQELVAMFGSGAETEVDALLASDNPVNFEEAMKKLIDRRAGKKLNYEEASQKAAEAYTKLSAE